MDMYKKRELRKNNKLEENNPTENKFNKIHLSWYPGHMAKTKREIREKLDLIDIVYEVIDARMPTSSKIENIEDVIKDKPKILVMAKYDICDKKETDKFIKYYKSIGYHVVPVDLLTGKNVNTIIDISKESLIEANQKRANKGLKPRSIRALIMGVPNAGKSTLINRLVGKKSASTANKPGHTKALSWIRINKDVELLDTPGILWPKFEDQEEAAILASLSSIKEEIVDKGELSCFILKKLSELYPERLKMRYGIEELDEDFIETFDIIAQKRGALGRGGIADYEKVSNIIIQDLKNGYFGDLTFDRLEKE